MTVMKRRVTWVIGLSLPTCLSAFGLSVLPFKYFCTCAGFLESLWRDIDMSRLNQDGSSDTNLIMVTHGLTSRVFFMKWFKWTVDQFERLNNPGNCEIRVMQLGPGGDYSLAIHHTTEELVQWGLSPEMIADQRWRATANRGSWSEDFAWYLDTFFVDLKDSDEEEEPGDCNSLIPK